MRYEPQGLQRYANTDPSRHFNHHVSEECTYQKHEECHDQRCACPHHMAVKENLGEAEGAV